MAKDIIADFTGASVCETVPAYQYDHGRRLVIKGTDIEEPVEVHFSAVDRGGEAVVRLAEYKDGILSVKIPDAVLRGFGGRRDYNMHAYIYYDDGDTGATLYHATTPVKARPIPAEDIPDAEEKTALQQALDALRNIPEIDVTDTDDGYAVTIKRADGTTDEVFLHDGQDGKDGADGRDGVDGQNGRDGADGKDGQNGADGKDGRNGADGEDGKSAYQIACDTGAYRGKYNLSCYCDVLSTLDENEIVDMIAGGTAFVAGTVDGISVGDVVVMQPANKGDVENGYYVVGTVSSYNRNSKALVLDSTPGTYTFARVDDYHGDVSAFLEYTIDGKMSEADWLDTLSNHDAVYDYACDNYLYIGSYSSAGSDSLDGLSVDDVLDGIKNGTEIQITSGRVYKDSLAVISAGDNGVCVAGFVSAVRNDNGDKYATIDLNRAYYVTDESVGTDDDVLRNAQMHGSRSKDLWYRWAAQAILAQA